MTARDEITQDFPRILDIILRLTLLAALLIYSFQILEPFLMIILWAAILSVSSAPLYKKISKMLGNRPKTAAAATSFVLLMIILIPSFYLAESLVAGVSLVNDSWQQGKIQIPPPTEQIKDFPLIGHKIFDYWSLAFTNIERLLEPLAPYLKAVSGWVLGAAKSIGIVVVNSIFSIIMAGVLLAHSERCNAAMKRLSI